MSRTATIIISIIEWSSCWRTSGDVYGVRSRMVEVSIVHVNNQDRNLVPLTRIVIGVMWSKSRSHKPRWVRSLKQTRVSARIKFNYVWDVPTSRKTKFFPVKHYMVIQNTPVVSWSMVSVTWRLCLTLHPPRSTCWTNELNALNSCWQPSNGQR